MPLVLIINEHSKFNYANTYFFILFLISTTTAIAKKFYVSVNAFYNIVISKMRYGKESYNYYNFFVNPKLTKVVCSAKKHYLAIKNYSIIYNSN